MGFAALAQTESVSAPDLMSLGPGGGDAGGRVVASSPPEELVRMKTATGVALGPVLARS